MRKKIQKNLKVKMTKLSRILAGVPRVLPYTRVQKQNSGKVWGYIYTGDIYKLAPQARNFLRKIAKIIDFRLKLAKFWKSLGIYIYIYIRGITAKKAPPYKKAPLVCPRFVTRGGLSYRSDVE